MAAYKDKNGKWYISVYYDTWDGKRSRKVKRGFSTKREALEWEREFLNQEKGDLDMTFISPAGCYPRILLFKEIPEFIRLSGFNWKMFSCSFTVLLVVPILVRN